MKLSILTATYNREKYLPKLYESIKNNLIYGLNAEWIIVDDGSKDNTKEIVKKFINENMFEIKYFHQENKGKMSAINEAVKHITGELCVECDSDDVFIDGSFKIIKENARILLENNELYGLAFLYKYDDGKISGKFFTKEITTMFDLYFKENVGGEKRVVFNSKIRKKYSYELEGKERFVTEARMYHKIDEKYKLYAINSAIEQGTYNDDGYTKNINKIFLENPKGYYMYFKEILQKNMKKVIFGKRIYVIKHYILFSYLTGEKFNSKLIKSKINKFLYTILWIPGIIKSKKFVKK